MDIATLTTLAMGFLTVMATKAGEDVYGKAKELTVHVYETLRTRFAREQDSGKATQALQALVDGDTDFSGVVEKKLLTMLKADPAFAQQLAQLVQSGPSQLLIAAEEAKASHISMDNTRGQGRQEINLGTRASAKDVHFNIGHEKPAQQ